MKKQIVLFMCILLLAGCAPQQQPPSQETNASVEAPVSSSTAQSLPESEPAADASSVPPVSPASSAPQVPEAPQEPEIPAPPTKVSAALTVSYGETPRFSQTLSVPADASYSGDADTVKVERQNGAVWETLRDGAGSFTLEGKLTVNGPLPQRVSLDAVAGGVLYRVTTLLQTDKGGMVTATSTFRAGETFADDAAEMNLATGGTFESVTTVHMSGKGLLPFTQTVTNASGQTVSLGRHYKVLSQSGGGVWKEASYPRGEEPAVTEDLLILLPGQSAELSGTLPVTAEQAKRGGSYKIVRSASLVSPREGQEQGIEFATQLEAGSAFQESRAGSEAPLLQNVELRLGQTSFLAGEAPLRAYIENKSDTPIVVGKIRVYNVKDGENLLEEADGPRPEIPAGAALPVLETTLELEPGEYTVEAAIRVKDSGMEASFSKNFTVEADKLKNPASASTVEMKVETGGENENGLALFRQTFVNNSSQTLLAGREFRVEQQAGGLWAKAQYPAGSEPNFPEDMVLLRPGSSVTFEGVLPFTSRNMPGMYRITRTLMVENPTPAQTNGLTLVYTVTKK